jgi:hypothetical protein
MLALRYRRRQCQDVDTGIAQGSEFTAIAGRDRIKKKMAGPTCLPADVPDKLLTGIQNKAAAPAACRQRLKVGDVHTGPPICL